ncbi:hypothetical protein ACFV3R_32160 [Streptomyces sp. NPDC059740]|uniref:hypothetical protein n=1 Tax=Streptomyces sp. NPDC059740 TaxID=3346926 RepID=UPI00365F2C56
MHEPTSSPGQPHPPAPLRPQPPGTAPAAAPGPSASRDEAAEPPAAHPPRPGAPQDLPDAVGSDALGSDALGPDAVGPATAEDPPGPRPLGLSTTPTGHADVDEALTRLSDADHLEVGDHLQVYEDVHHRLRDTLAALDQRPGPPPPQPSGTVRPAPPGVRPGPVGAGGPQGTSYESNRS